MNSQNTLLLYFRMLFIMAVSLCTSRIGKKTNSAIPLYTNTSEVVECIYGFGIERFYDEQGNETEMVAMKTGSDTSGIIMNKWLINQIDIKCRH